MLNSQNVEYETPDYTVAPAEPITLLDGTVVEPGPNWTIKPQPGPADASGDGLRPKVIALYRDGRTEKEILANSDRLAQSDPVWEQLKQSTLSRWIRQEKGTDPDLEIWHLLNRRRCRPGLYTHWIPSGQIILGSYFDDFTQTLYLAPGADYSHLPGRPGPQHIVRSDAGPSPQSRRRRDRDSAGPYLAHLRALGYSLREIKLLWDDEKTGHPELDYTEWVRFLVSELRKIRTQSRSHATIRNILEVYQAGPMPESVRQVIMAG